MTPFGLGVMVLKVVIVFGAIQVAFILLTWVERRVSGFIQNRLGPNRVGPEGLLQPLADGIKLLFKEDLILPFVDRTLYILAPAFITVPALITFAVIPFGDRLIFFGHEIPLIIADINVGLLYIFAISSLGVYGIVLAGWASNNKYSLLGALRSSAQMISYELALGLSIMGVLMITGSLSLLEVVRAQSDFFHWNVFRQPVGSLIFLVSIFAETNRLPFDLPEAEPELVAGYHTEYSSMKFALFYLAEYVNVITGSALIVTLFFGGWQAPGLYLLGLPPLAQSLIQVLAFALKTAMVMFFFVWVRWTLPRFRYDQLMRMGWKFFLPLGIVNILLTGLGILLLT